MSKIKNGGLDQYGALNPSNSSNLEQLALKGLNTPTTNSSEVAVAVQRLKQRLWPHRLGVSRCDQRAVGLLYSTETGINCVSANNIPCYSHFRKSSSSSTTVGRIV